jgi:hypothetical protein
MKDGKSPAKILSQFGKAVEGTYRAHGFNEMDERLACLVLRIGGPRLLHALHVKLHLPCVSKVYASSMYKSLRVFICPTAKRDTMARFMQRGISTYAEVERKLKGSGLSIGQPVQLMVDETALNDVVSYCSATNSILGIARQGTTGRDFEVQSIEDVNRVRLLLDSEELKRSTEATVLAIAPFRAHHYRGVPVFITGCVKGKREDDNLLEQFQLFGELWERARVEGGCGHGVLGPLIVTASDGDAARRKDFMEGYCNKEVSTVSELEAALKSMPLLDLEVGQHGMVGSFDWKHMIKRLRSRLITKVMGVTMSSDGILTRDLLQRLLETGLGRSFASVFDPSDRQNVPLAVQCLRATVELSKVVELPAGIVEVPSLRTAMDDMRLLGTISEYLLSVLVDSEKSVSYLLQQLAKLSHILLVVYREHRTKFIPGQLYHDIQATVRAAFFVAAQLKLSDDVNAEFFLWMLGSDRLEGLFRDVRTLNHSSNFSLKELGDKLGAAVHLSALTADMPDIDRKSRLKVGSDDHMNAVSWTGSTKLSGVNLCDCWLQGRLGAVEALNAHPSWARVTVQDFVQLAAAGCTALLPYGRRGGMPGVSVDADVNLDDDVDVGASSEGRAVQQSSHEGLEGGATGESEEGDDEFAVETVVASALSEAPAALGGEAVEMTMRMEGQQVFKASAVRIICNGESGARSSDRLRRVMGATPFTVIQRQPTTDVDEAGSADLSQIFAGDPFAALVRVPNGGVVLAVVVATRNYSPAVGGLVHGTVVSLRHYTKGDGTTPSVPVTGRLGEDGGSDHNIDDANGGGDIDNDDDYDDDDGSGGGGGDNDCNGDCIVTAASPAAEGDSNAEDDDDNDNDAGLAVVAAGRYIAIGAADDGESSGGGSGGGGGGGRDDGGGGGNGGGGGGDDDDDDDADDDDNGGVVRIVADNTRLVWDGARGSAQNSRALNFDRNRVLPLDADEVRNGKAEWDEGTLIGIQSMLLQVTDVGNRASLPALTAAVEAALPLPYLPSLVTVPNTRVAPRGGLVVCSVEGCGKMVKFDTMRDHVALHFAKGTLSVPASCWDWCGFCGRANGCNTVLRKGSSATSIIINSNCPMAPTGRKGASALPNDCCGNFKTQASWNKIGTSNVPLPCVLCAMKQIREVDVSASTSGKGKGGGLYSRLYDGTTYVWKFAMGAHINEAHPSEELPTVADWAALYKVDEELRQLRNRR